MPRSSDAEPKEYLLAKTIERAPVEDLTFLRMNLRTILGSKGRPGWLLSLIDKTYPVWRAGANPATALHTDADLDIKGLAVPKGDYTVFVLVDTDPWQLIINKQTGQWDLTYNKDQDLGRVPMDMSKPPAPIETYKMTLSSMGPSAAKLQLEFENFIASVPFTVK